MRPGLQAAQPLGPGPSVPRRSGPSSPRLYCRDEAGQLTAPLWGQGQCSPLAGSWPAAISEAEHVPRLRMLQHSEGGGETGSPPRACSVPRLTEVRETPSPSTEAAKGQNGKVGPQSGSLGGTSWGIRWHRSFLPCPWPPWASPACCPQLLCPTRTTMIGRSARHLAALASSHPVA